MNTPLAPRAVKLDPVSATATIAFMRANGLDGLVDAYGVHTYPSTDDPGKPAVVAGRRDRLAKYVLAQCQPEGSASGKPCWITEWGIPNHDASCPAHETNQITLVNETRANFRSYVAQKRVLALLYYAWVDEKGDPFSIYRCNQLTQTGRLALAPF